MTVERCVAVGLDLVWPWLPPAIDSLYGNVMGRWRWLQALVRRAVPQ